MNEKQLQVSLDEYSVQLTQVREALENTSNDTDTNSLLSLQEDLQQLVQLTQESLNAISTKNSVVSTEESSQSSEHQEVKNEMDDEYALFMAEMSKTGAFDKMASEEAPSSSKEVNNLDSNSGDSDIENELSTLLGMKCAVFHTYKWGGQPVLHNAMVSAVVPKQHDDQFQDLQVQVLFTHPTHAEMLPCPFFLGGECKFDEEQCRYSHGAVVQLSNLKEAIEPDFDAVEIGSKVLIKLKPPDSEDMSLTKKSAEKYHIWHRGLVKKINPDRKSCLVKLDHNINTGEKRKTDSSEFTVAFEDLFPLNDEYDDTDSDDSLSDTEYPDSKTFKPDTNDKALLIEDSLQNNTPAMGEWERHTRGIGSKLMIAMGYVPGTGLGASSDGRLQPVEARIVPVGKSLDQCMELSEKATGQDPLKLEQKLKRIQKKEEERNKRAYEREEERERRNVFNFLNRTLGDKTEEQDACSTSSLSDIKLSTNKNLNIEKFKLTEEVRKVERELSKLNNSLSRQSEMSGVYKSITVQITEKNKELNILKNKEQQIAKEITLRKDKEKMTVF